MNIKKIISLYENSDKKERVFEEMGIKKTTFHDIINGKTNTSVQNIEKIAKYFGVPIGYFFDEENGNNQSVIGNSNSNFQQGEHINDIRTFANVITETRKDYQKIIETKDEQIKQLIEIINKLSTK